MPSASTPLSSPIQVGVRAISVVHCVSAKHEHQVEEQLKRRDALAFAHDGRQPGGALLRGGAHRHLRKPRKDRA